MFFIKNPFDDKKEDAPFDGKQCTQLAETPATFEKTMEGGERLHMKPLNKGNVEETLLVTRRDALEKENSASIESLKEIKNDDAIVRKSINNNQSKRGLQELVEDIPRDDEENVETRNSESERELETKYSLKKKKGRKKKGKRGVQKDLPPILVMSKRPLPQLAAVDKKAEHEVKR